MPEVPLRQWVLSVPFELRLLLARDPRALTAVGRIFLQEILAARFKIRIHSPSLEERREDIPLLVHAALRSIAAMPTSNARRFFPHEDVHGEPRVSRALMWTLLHHRYVAHFRELEALLWKSVDQSLGDTLEPFAEADRTAARSARVKAHEAPAAIDPASLPREVVQAALERNDWVVEQAFRELGVSSRHVLTRLMARHPSSASPLI